MAGQSNKIDEFTRDEIRRYVSYVADSYTYLRKFVPKDILVIMDHFYAINKFIKESNDRYKEGK